MKSYYQGRLLQQQGKIKEAYEKYEVEAVCMATRSIRMEAIIKIIFIMPANTGSLWTDTAPDDGPFARSLQPLRRQNQA